MQGPVLLCGLGTVGWRILEFLRTAGMPVVAIDQHADPEDPRLAGVRYVRGDFRLKSVLLDAGITDARGILIVTSDDLCNISAAFLVRSVNPDVRIVLRMFNQNLIARLSKAVRNVTALSVSALSAPLLALAAMTGGVLAAFPLGDGRRQIAEVTIAQGSRLVGRRIGEVADNDRFHILAHGARLLQQIDRDTKLQPGDSIVICGDPLDVERLSDPGNDTFEVLWAGKLRRYGRLFYRALAEMDLAVKICSSILIGVILLSTAVYHYALNSTWSDAVYQSISVMATGADMRGGGYEAEGKVFISFLRIAGTALIAAFTAIVTNALLTARLGGAFEVRRIPDKGHVVVCGLGNLGYRVVEELGKLDERVVVVERKADNSFIASCRRQGAAVVIGDATLPEVLRQARVDTARAVVAATSSDLVNLEVALLVAEINSDQRVVVRMGEGVLAETVRQAASVKLALSVAELAAPAFAAALLGERVQAMFLIGEQMLAVLEISVTEGRYFNEHSLRVLAIDYQFVPLAVLNAQNESRVADASYRLQPTDRLVIVAPLDQLDRLMRREPPPVIWSVEVVSFPPPMREDLLVRAGTMRHLPRDEAEHLLQTTPFLLAERLTFGQAEEIRILMDRERIVTRLIRPQSPALDG